MQVTGAPAAGGGIVFVQKRHCVARGIYGDEGARLEVIIERSWMIPTLTVVGELRGGANDNHNIILQAVGSHKT